MNEVDSFIDYYKILDCDRTATISELKKAYQQLILSSHPDKDDGGNCGEIFLLAQKAWSVLRDPEARKQYDAILACHENSELLLFDTIQLSEMNFDFSDNAYTYSCRCGGTYILEASDTLPSNIIIGCDECSFSIQVNR